MLLEVKRLWVRFEKVEVLKGISLEVVEGSISALLGSNGAGKTTTLKTISGIVKPAQGEIFFEGSAIHHLQPEEVARLGIAHVPEGRRIFPYMTVLENIKVGAYLRPHDRSFQKDLDSIYSWFPILRERSNQLGGSLSGGEQEMLAIARGLMIRPKLVLLDEPSLGLAPLIVLQVENIIARIHQQGVSMILVEQNAAMALRLANRGYVLETGNIVLADDAQRLIDNEQVKKVYLGL